MTGDVDLPAATVPKRRRSGSASTVLQLGAIAGATILVKVFVFQAFFIPSASMQPTLVAGDRVAVNKLAYRLGEVERGDIVVFDGRGTFDLPGTPARDYIKRVVAVAGDTVTCCDAQGRVVLNGRPLDEQFVAPSDPDPFVSTVVPEGHVWVMGDNRGNSLDSRVHGPVPQDQILGRAEAVYWPLQRRGLLQ